jgi:hypothetical protein
MDALSERGPSAQKQSIEELQKRYQRLNERKFKAEANLETARQQLDRLKQEAREKYGTDDVAELGKQLDAMQDENELKRSKYQADLDRIERDLAAVEEKFAAAEQASNGNGE